MELCVALDMPSMDENLTLVRSLAKYNIWLKVGFRSYIRDGNIFIREIKEINPNFKIFLDLKLYDIPNTMADTAESIASLHVDMFNVHASAGKVAMQAVMQRLKKFDNRPIVLAVTALTSFNNHDFKEIYGLDIKQKADQFAIDAYESNLDGVVCSAHESISIKNMTSNSFITLTPGIRPFGEDSQDQQRVADLEFAKNANIDFIVVGRPIYNSINPQDKVEKILQHIVAK